MIGLGLQSTRVCSGSNFLQARQLASAFRHSIMKALTMKVVRAIGTITVSIAKDPDLNDGEVSRPFDREFVVQSQKEGLTTRG